MALVTMKELLKDAQDRNYGIGYFNAVNLEMIRAYIHAAEECESPIIIGTAEALLPISSFSWIVPIMLDEAQKAKVPVAVHLDHGYSFDVIMQALRAGFGSVMYDGSRDASTNIQNSKKIIHIAHAMGVAVECEIGSVSGLSDESGKADKMIYTDPLDAVKFVEETNVDFLAVSIGTVHGTYLTKPQLDIPRLKKIHEMVNVPIVLHGGSGLSDADFRNTISNGVCKVNVYTDIIDAARSAVEESVRTNSSATYTDINLSAEKAMKEATIKKLMIFGSTNKA